MAKLANVKKERFARLYAMYSGLIDNKDIVIAAGYAENSRNKSYASSQASRLLAERDVALRIQEIREEYNMMQGDGVIRDHIVRYLCGVLNLDITQYFKVNQVTSRSGRIYQDIILKNKDFNNMPASVRKLITGFDTKTGNPIFIDKFKALSMLKEIFVDTKDQVVIEDMAKMFSDADLQLAAENDPALNKFIDGDKYRRVFSDEDDENDELDKNE